MKGPIDLSIKYTINEYLKEIDEGIHVISFSLGGLIYYLNFAADSSVIKKFVFKFLNKKIGFTFFGKRFFRYSRYEIAFDSESNISNGTNFQKKSSSFLSGKDALQLLDVFKLVIKKHFTEYGGKVYFARPADDQDDPRLEKFYNLLKKVYEKDENAEFKVTSYTKNMGGDNVTFYEITKKHNN